MMPPNGLELSCPAEAGKPSLILAHNGGPGTPPYHPARRVSFSELLGGVMGPGHAARTGGCIGKWRSAPESAEPVGYLDSMGVNTQTASSRRASMPMAMRTFLRNRSSESDSRRVYPLSSTAPVLRTLSATCFSD